MSTKDFAYAAIAACRSADYVGFGKSAKAARAEARAKAKASGCRKPKIQSFPLDAKKKRTR